MAPRYALKGPVYLQSAEGVVTVPRGLLARAAPCNPMAIDALLGGTLAAGDADLTATTTAGETVVLRVFDHVLVRVDVVPNFYRQADFRFELLGWAGPSSNGGSGSGAVAAAAGPGKNAIFATVREQQQQQQQQQQPALAPPKPKTKKPTLYETLEQLRTLSLTENPA